VLVLISAATLSAHIAGLTPYGHADFTPLAIIMEEYFGINVRADSPVRSAADMLERLRKSPDALTFGTASIAGNNFTSLATALKKGGVDVKRLKAVSFTGGGEITMALLGGHIDVISTGLSNMSEHLQSGKMRTLVITGPKRMWGPFADVPTWREVGVNVVESSWRGMMGAKGLTPAQIAYWEGVFRKVVQTDEWKQELKENYWVGTYMGAAETNRRLDAEYADLKQILVDLGIAKVK
jgi:putative tricarboxylic transport membrane protein